MSNNLNLSHISFCVIIANEPYWWLEFTYQWLYIYICMVDVFHTGTSWWFPLVFVILWNQQFWLSFVIYWKQKILGLFIFMVVYVLQGKTQHFLSVLHNIQSYHSWQLSWMMWMIFDILFLQPLFTSDKCLIFMIINILTLENYH